MPNEAIKYDAGKPRTELLMSGPAFIEIAHALTYGASKYTLEEGCDCGAHAEAEASSKTNNGRLRHSATCKTRHSRSGDFNYAEGKGLNWLRLAGAIGRHLAAWLMGEDTDPESGLHPLAHCGASVVMLLNLILWGKGIDARFVNVCDLDHTPNAETIAAMQEEPVGKAYKGEEILAELNTQMPTFSCTDCSREIEGYRISGDFQECPRCHACVCCYCQPESA